MSDPHHNHDAHHGHGHHSAAAHATPAACAHDHDHDHGHAGHHHHVDPATTGFLPFAVSIGLNTAFVAIEFFYGWVAHSTALMADAGHNLSDVLGLVLAWSAVVLARKAPSQRFTYGLRASSILAALANSMLLLLACGAIGWEALTRLTAAPEVAGWTVTIVAGIGVLVNGLSAWLLVHNSKNDTNIRAAYLHMLADAAVSVAVVLGGFAMVWTHWYWLDSVLSLAIVLVIVWGTWGLLRESLGYALHAVPARVDAAAVAQFLRSVEGVSDIHDLHIWGLSTTETALTVHLVTPAGYPGDAAMDAMAHTLKERFHIHHSTLQTELGSTPHQCGLAHAA